MKVQKGHEYYSTAIYKKIRVLDDQPVNMKSTFTDKKDNNKNKLVVGEYVFCSWLQEKDKDIPETTKNAKKHKFTIEKGYLPISSFRKYQKKSEKIQKTLKKEDNL